MNNARDAGEGGDDNNFTAEAAAAAARAVYRIKFHLAVIVLARARIAPKVNYPPSLIRHSLTNRTVRNLVMKRTAMPL